MKIYIKRLILLVFIIIALFDRDIVISIIVNLSHLET